MVKKSPVVTPQWEHRDREGLEAACECCAALVQQSSEWDGESR
jgi:hypothetical protein